MGPLIRRPPRTFSRLDVTVLVIGTAALAIIIGLILAVAFGGAWS